MRSRFTSSSFFLIRLQGSSSHLINSILLLERATSKFMLPSMFFQCLCIFFGSPQREADFWNHWNSQFHDAQNPSEKHGFIFDHKIHEIWCAQNASQRSLFRIFIVLAWDFCKIKESALPRLAPLTFFSCCRAGASTHSWFLQHLPIENRLFRRRKPKKC